MIQRFLIVLKVLRQALLAPKTIFLFCTGLVLTFLAALVPLLLPIYLGKMEYVVAHKYNLIVLLVIFIYGPLKMFSLMIKNFVAVILARPLAECFVIAAEQYVRQAIFLHPAILQNLSSAQIVSAISQVQDVFSNVIYLSFFLLLPTLVTMFCMLGMICVFLGWSYFFILIGFTLLYAWLVKRNLSNLNKFQKTLNRYNLNFAHKIGELFFCREFIFANDMACFELQTFSKDIHLRSSAETAFFQQLGWFELQQSMLTGSVISLFLIFAFFNLEVFKITNFLLIIYAKNKFILPVLECTKLLRNLIRHLSLLGSFEWVNKLVLTQEKSMPTIPIICRNDGQEFLFEIDDIGKVDELSITSITVQRGQEEVFQNFTAEIKSLGLTVVAGVNGSGKTTLLRTILGLDIPSAGEIVLKKNLGQSIFLKDTSWGSRNNFFAFVEQNPTLLTQTIYYNLFYGINQDSLNDKKTDSIRIFLGDELWNNVYLWAGNSGKNISHGDAVKIRIGQAILKDTPFLLLDEPTNNLDNASLKQLFTLLKKLSQKKAVIVSTHNQDLIDMADAVILLKK